MRYRLGGFLFVIGIFSMTVPVIVARSEPSERSIQNNQQTITARVPENPKAIFRSLEIEEVATIGKSASDYLFQDIRSLAVDDKGRVYILDPKALQVFVFDENGRLLLMFGTKGQGPGEFQAPVMMSLHADKEIVVNDLANARIEFFTLKGQLLREVSRAHYFRMTRLRVNSQGNIIGQNSTRGEGMDIDEIICFSPELNPLWKISALIRETAPRDTIGLFSPVVNFHVLKNDDLVWIQTDKYELNIVGSSGLSVRTIIKDSSPEPITEDAKKRAIERWAEGQAVPPDLKFVFPKDYPPIHYINVDDEDRIYIWTYQRNPEGKGLCDIFSREGIFLLNTPLEDFPRVIRGNKFYVIREDPEGFPVVKVYSVKWKT